MGGGPARRRRDVAAKFQRRDFTAESAARRVIAEPRRRRHGGSLGRINRPASNYARQAGGPMPFQLRYADTGILFFLTLGLLKGILPFASATPRRRSSFSPSCGAAGN